jgi:phenylalanyl-tRNA synthetase beta chain
MVRTLLELGFSVEGDIVTVPSWRSDISHYADLAEEVARFYGYDNIAPTLMRGGAAQGGYSDKQNFERELGRLCRGLGYYEIMTYSFGSRNAWDKLRLGPTRRSPGFYKPKPLG